MSNILSIFVLNCFRPSHNFR